MVLRCQVTEATWSMTSSFQKLQRTPNPNSAIRGFERSAMTINFIRALIDGGFADLHHPEYWDLGFVEHSPKASEYQAIVASIAESLRVSWKHSQAKPLVQSTALNFLQAMRVCICIMNKHKLAKYPRRTGWYDLSCHFPWIGAQELLNLMVGISNFSAGLQNPIGDENWHARLWTLNKLLDVLTPRQTKPGRMTLIHRYGAEDKVADERYQNSLKQVQETGKQGACSCQ